MGQGITLTCSKCGKEHTYMQGIGFMYHFFLEETKKDVLAGKCGKEAQLFMTEHPDAEFDARKEIYYCSKCQHLKQGVSIHIADGDNIFHNEYRCGKCKKVKMKPIKITEMSLEKLKKIPCPKCGATDGMILGFLMWD